MDAGSFERNDKLDIRYRKIGNGLVVSGMGIVFLGLWAVIRVFAQMALGQLNLMEFLMSGTDGSADTKALMITVFAMILILLIISHYYVGKCAIQVGIGKKNHYLYLLIVVFLLYLNLAGFKEYFDPDFHPTQYDITIASFLVDVASSATFLNMIISSIIYYGMRKIAGED